MLRKFFKLTIGVVICILIYIVIYRYFNISGNKIIGISDLTTSSNVVIRKSYLEITNKQEYVLDDNQIEMLKSLVLQSNFTKSLSNTIRFNDKNMYEIIINDNEADISLIIHSIGNEWISIANQYKGKHLKINNPEWKSTLEEIITLSN